MQAPPAPLSLLLRTTGSIVRLLSNTRFFFSIIATFSPLSLAISGNTNSISVDHDGTFRDFSERPIVVAAATPPETQNFGRSSGGGGAALLTSTAAGTTSTSESRPPPGTSDDETTSSPSSDVLVASRKHHQTVEDKLIRTDPSPKQHDVGPAGQKQLNDDNPTRSSSTWSILPNAWLELRRQIYAASLSQRVACAGLV